MGGLGGRVGWLGLNNMITNKWPVLLVWSYGPQQVGWLGIAWWLVQSVGGIQGFVVYMNSVKGWCCLWG